MIEGLQIKRLKRYPDSRGYFMEVIRETDPFFDGFGQWSISKMATGTIKAWHVHQAQTDYWLVPAGVVRAVFCDMRLDSPTYKHREEYILGDDREPMVIKIPPGVAHGLQVLQGPAFLSYITSHIYNPDDEGRIPHDDERIAYDWQSEVIV